MWRTAIGRLGKRALSSCGTRTPLQYTVYDNYKPTENVTAHPFVAAVGYDTSYTLYPSGLTTSTKTRLLGTDDWLTETIYYDDRSRVIQTLCHYPERDCDIVIQLMISRVMS